MRIAVPSDSGGLDAAVSPHFGRCPYFVLIDLEDGDIQRVQTLENPFFGSHEPGQVPGFMHSQGANVMLTGGMGSRAIHFFGEFGIQPVTGASGTVHHALKQYLSGDLTGAAPCLQSKEHHHQEVPPEGTYEKDDVGRLREEIDMLRQQMNDVDKRLDDADK